MALFLIYDKDNTNPDLTKDARGCYKRGDIVEVLDDSKHDGDIVKNPIASPFYLVRIAGITKTQADKYMESHHDTNDQYIVLKRRKFRVLLDSIPNSIKNALKNNRYVEVSFSQVKNYIQNKVTLTTE